MPSVFGTAKEIAFDGEAGENGERHDHRSLARADVLPGMATLFAAVIFAGFSRTYYLKALFVNLPLTPLIHLHGIVFTCWLVLFITQTTLIAAKRTDLHRRLGVFGAVLAGVMIVVGPMTAIAPAKRGFSVPGGPPPLVS